MDPEDAFSSCFPSSSTSTRRRTCGYDVFLSFSGSDTRKKFTSHLFEAFKRNGIIAFRDDESLDRGAFIKPELLKAIEESEFAVVIFSGGYASSSWCLTELAKIVECMYKKTLTVLPVFYDVDPSDVRKLRGTFAVAFAKHLIDNTENVQTWKDAVSDVAGIPGWDLRDESESTVIEKIIQTINKELDREVPTASQEIGSIPDVKADIENIMNTDVKAEIENIMNTVSTIQDVLDAAELQSHSHQVKDSLEKLEDAVYEADDLLGEFYTEALRRGGMSGNFTEKVRYFLSTSSPLVLRQGMSGKINAMKQKLNAIAEDSKLSHLKEYHVEPPVSMDREETHSFVPAEKVIGREDDKKAIIKLLLEPNNEENVSIVPIVGIGGLGKTTLAQFVYNDKNIKEHFELKMWICISDVFDVKMIIQKIISATGEKLEGHSMDKSQDQLRKIINQKKYLLVLDDVWNKDPQEWERLENLLVGGAKGSKIVITMRERLVADITRTAAIYTLKCLNKEQSWLLFKQIAFRKGQGQGTNNPRLEEIGREIVHKCQGVPLAIKSIGNVLRMEKTEHKWSYVKKNILEIATRQKNDIFPILKLSYDHLPSHLKSCFAFCSLFPKDYEIDKVTLIQLWIAQGFIRPSNKNQELEDVADEYFKDLLCRSFFEEVTDAWGQLKYKMHDLIHDLAQLVAGAECTIITLDGNNFDEKTRHVSLPFYIDSSFIETSGLLVRAEKLRTCLLTFKPGMAYMVGVIDGSMLNKLIMSCRRLRALGLCGVHIERVPDSIEKLIHLTYLDFSKNPGIETLPNAISRLWKLQTLKVNGCRNLKELPRDIRFLVGLRHLENSNCWLLSHMPNGLGQMTCLQTLSSFVVRDNQASTSGPISSGLDELNSLNSLRGELQISNLSNLEDVYLEPNAANLRAKQYLDRLTLSWHANDSYDGNYGDEKILNGLQPHQNLKFLYVNGYGGVRFSSWLSLLTNLVDLYIDGCKRCQQLPRLSQLHSLERLSLENMEVLEYVSDGDINEEVPTSSFFPSLKSICISNCPNLKGWWRSTSTTDHQQHLHHQSLPSFHHLSYLLIEDCPNLTSLPPFLYLEESLYLYEVSLKPLQRTIAMNSSHPSSSSLLSSPFSKLMSLTLSSIKDTEALPDDWMSNLSSLKKLRIDGGSKLKSLSLAVPHLTSLESLVILNCELFDSINAAHLREKKYLDRLGLLWHANDHLSCSDNDNDGDEKALKGLQPHKNLRSLLMQGYRGVRFSCWLSLLINLVDLTLIECKKCRHLPPLCQLPSLERLSLLYMEDLEYISDKDITEEVTSLVTSTTFFVSLNFLKIYECPNLKGWWRRDFCVTTYASKPDHQQHRHRQLLPSFPRLSSLHIQICPYLTSMPLFPHLEECLFLDKVSGKPLQHTMATAFSHLSPFSKLMSMHLINIRDLVYLPGLNMCSLKSLVISNCPRLASLSRAVQYLTSLEELVIHNCEEFNPLNEVNDGGQEWKCLNCLRSLTFDCLPKLESLPVGLQHVSTLQKLVISNCPNLIILPEWICKLTSFEQIEIVNCSNLTSVPDGMLCLTSLQKLRTEDHPT